jgi:hypothetical protein
MGYAIEVVADQLLSGGASMQKPHNVARCHRSAAISCCEKSSQVPKSKRFVAAQSCLTFFEHDLFGKPLQAFPDHALAKSRPVKVR